MSKFPAEGKFVSYASEILTSLWVGQWGRRICLIG